MVEFALVFSLLSIILLLHCRLILLARLEKSFSGKFSVSYIKRYMES